MQFGTSFLHLRLSGEDGRFLRQNALTVSNARWRRHRRRNMGEWLGGGGWRRRRRWGWVVVVCCLPFSSALWIKVKARNAHAAFRESTELISSVIYMYSITRLFPEEEEDATSDISRRAPIYRWQIELSGLETKPALYSAKCRGAGGGADWPKLREIRQVRKGTISKS